nr:restriction endonuclease subunit S [uncultured Deefgea sp.]
MSVVGKAGYKETAIGWIPEEWQFLPISSVANESKLRSENDGALPVLLCSKHFGFVRSLDFFKKKIFSDDTSNYKVVQRNWIAYPSNHIEEGSIGLQNICDAGIVSPIYTVFIPSEGIFADYLIRVLKTDVYRQQYVTAMSGSVDRRGSLRWTQFSKIHIPVPSWSEQKKIAAILGAVDDKLDVIARQIAATNTLKRGLMQILFSQGVGTQDDNGQWHPHTEFQQTELGEIPAGWTVQPMGSLLRQKPEYGANASAVNFGGEHQIRYLRITDIDENGKLRSDSIKAIVNEEAQDYLLHDADLLIARSGNTVGKSILYREEMGLCAFAGYLLRFRFDANTAVEYVSTYLTTDAYWAWIKSVVKVGAQPNVNAQQYQSMPIPVPPLAEQQRIAAILADFEDKLDCLRSKQTHYQTLKRGLMQKLLTGEWRVKVA